MTLSRDPADPVSQSFADLHQLAAVSGVFDPLAMVRGDANDPEQRKALIALARDCQEFSVAGKVGWLLKPDVRRAVLARVDRGNIRKLVTLAKEASLESDAFGEQLHRALLGREPSMSKLKSRELDALSTALEFVAELDATKMQRSAEARRWLAREQAESALRMVAPDELLGRDDEYAALLQFMRERTVPEIYRAGTYDSASTSAKALLITGIGGVGKSALVSSFAYNTRRFTGNAPLILLDFDRPALNDSDPLELTFELTRQLGLQKSALAQPFSAMRREAREFAETVGPPKQRDFETVERIMSGAFSNMRQHVETLGLADLPIVLILETFEEVLVRGPEATEFVFRWLDGLKEDGGLSNLRTIISGRSAPDETLSVVGHRFVGHIRLQDLRPAPAEKFLSKRKVPKKIAAKVVEIYGGNPLMLLIFARYYKESREDRAEIDAILTGPDSVEKLTGEMAQSFLYDRILKRIRDGNLRALAHPGLVLRRVTADLIEEVLQEPCGLEIGDEVTAQSLFVRLRGHWLVERDGMNAVQHRRDLRRLMLPLILEDEERRPQALEIHRLASEFYAENRDQTMTAEDQELESTYHRCFLVDEPDFSPEFCERLVVALGGDISDLPAKVRAYIKLHSGAGSSLNEAERALLADADRQEAIRVRQRTLLGTGSGAEAFDLGKSERQRSRGTGSGKTAPSSEDITAAFTTCAFEFLAEHAPLVLATLPEAYRRKSYTGRKQDFAFSDWWRCVLAARSIEMDSHWQDDVENSLHAWLDQISSRKLAKQYRQDEYAAVLEFAVVAHAVGRDDLAHLLVENALGADIKAPCDLQFWFKPKMIRSFAAFRFLRVMPNIPTFYGRLGGSIEINMNLFRIFGADFADRLSDERERQRKRTSSTNEESLRNFQEQIGRLKDNSVAGLDRVSSSIAGFALREESGRTEWGAGVLPEIHPPVRFALQQAIEDGFDLSGAIAELTANQIFWPEELQPSRLEKNPGSRVRLLPSIIDVSDRFGLLGPLLEMTRAKMHDHKLAERADRLLTGYEALLRSRDMVS